MFILKFSFTLLFGQRIVSIFKEFINIEHKSDKVMCEMKDFSFKFIVSLFIILNSLPLFSQDSAYARNIVNLLASEQFKGRGYVDSGLYRAAEYIQGEFFGSGLKAFGLSYEQSFSFSVNTFPGKMSVKTDDQNLVPGVDFIVDPYSGPARGEFDVVYVSKQDLLNTNKLNKKIAQSAGKFLLVDIQANLQLTADEEKQVNELINLLKYKSDLPHLGIIIFSGNKLSWGTATGKASRAILLVNKPGIKANSVKKVFVDIEAALIPGFISPNLIGYLPGNSVSDTFIVLTAHYDHLGMMGESTIFPGANDNASGVAMILNLANYFSENPPDYSIVFMALAGEEAGLLGASHFVKNPLFPLNAIKFLINFDLAGTGEEGIRVVNGSVYKEQFEKLVACNDSDSLLPAVKIRGEACNSDHCMFFQEGVPCFYIYTLGGISAYHDVFDKADTLPLTEFKDYFKLMVRFVEGFYPDVQQSLH